MRLRALEVQQRELRLEHAVRAALGALAAIASACSCVLASSLFSFLNALSSSSTGVRVSTTSVGELVRVGRGRQVVHERRERPVRARRAAARAAAPRGVLAGSGARSLCRSAAARRARAPCGRARRSCSHAACGRSSSRRRAARPARRRDRRGWTRARRGAGGSARAGDARGLWQCGPRRFPSRAGRSWRSAGHGRPPTYERFLEGTPCGLSTSRQGRLSPPAQLSSNL